MDKNSGNKQSNRIVVIGLDSADFYLIQKWVDEGHLPAMASLIARGSWGKLNSTADVGSNTVWPTFFTGTSPAKNYGFCIRRIKSGTYRVIDEPYANMIKREPFWLQLSRAGKRIAILDVPVTYPIEGLNGIHLVAWGVHGPCWHQDSWPPELIKEVISRFGSYPHSCPEIVSRYAEVNQMGEFYGELISGVKKKGSVSTYFLDQEAWDLFITVFAESHCAGHNLWYLMDENHPAYDSEIARTLGN